MGASLSLSTLTFAQGAPILAKRDFHPQTEVSQADSSEKDKTESTQASVSGTITDPNGAVIPNISVVLINEENKETRNVVSNEEGFYEFKTVAAGNYTIRAEELRV